ncbi:MAG: hypothetical protein H0W82_01130 [Actinobacteria bacterium]|nr:hypothetical protein [Actinomycetota bacterium]
MGEDGGGLRRAAAALLALIAAASLVVGAVSIGARRTLFDPSGVDALSSRLLDETAVRSAITDTLTTRLRSAVPLLRTPVVADGLDGLARVLAGTEGFRRAFGEAVAELQADLLSGSHHRQVALRLDGMLDAMLAALQDELGTTLPTPQVTGVLSVDPNQVRAYRGLNDATARAGWSAIVIGVLAALGAVLVAERRRRAIVGVGVTVAVVALVALGALMLARSAAAGAVGSAGRDVVGAVWDVAAGDVRVSLTVVLLAGLGTAVAGLALQAFRGDRRS